MGFFLSFLHFSSDQVLCTLYTAEKLNKNCYDFVHVRFSKIPLVVQIGLFEKQFCVGKCSTIYGEQRYDIFKILKVPVKVKKRFQWSTRQVVNGQTERRRNGTITSSKIEFLVGPFQSRFLRHKSSLLIVKFLSSFLPSFTYSTKCYSWIPSSFLFSRNFCKYLWNTHTHRREWYFVKSASSRDCE